MDERKQGRLGTVLCVDDEPHVLRALLWLLQKDFEVHTAGSAAEGLRLLARHDFDVVVSDQRMPGVSGVEFLKDVRSASPRAMRILLTGYADLEAMVRSVNDSEVFRFVTKPWDIRELPRLIAEAAAVARQSAPPPATQDLPPALDASASVVRMAASRASASPLPTTVALRQTESVLVIDDDPAVRQAVVDVIGSAVRVRHARNLAEAVHALDRSPAGVVISDVRVGEVDVTRLIRLLKQKHPESVAVVFSGVQDAQVVMDLINQGQVYRFIPKPFKPGFIRLVVDSALRRHRVLADDPSSRARHRVDPMSPDAVTSLRHDAVRLAAVAPVPALGAAAFVDEGERAGDGFLQRVSAGFRRLFGA